MQPYWAVATEQCLHRVLDDEVLVYSRASGMTHRLQGPEAWVFEQLVLGAATVGDLAAVAEVPGNASRAEAGASIERILAMFDHMGIVSRH